MPRRGVEPPYLAAQDPKSCVSTIPPPGHEAILPVNLTYSYKVVELPSNMADPTGSAILSKRRIETGSGFEGRPSAVSVSPLTTGEINNFQDPTAAPPSGTNQGLLEGPEAFLKRAREQTSLTETRRTVSEATREPLQK